MAGSYREPRKVIRDFSNPPFGNEGSARLMVAALDVAGRRSRPRRGSKQLGNSYDPRPDESWLVRQGVFGRSIDGRCCRRSQRPTSSGCSGDAAARHARHVTKMRGPNHVDFPVPAAAVRGGRMRRHASCLTSTKTAAR